MFLDFLLVLRLEQLDHAATDPTHPPLALLSLLSCIQVSFDATYISSAPVPAQPSPRIDTPPRTTSLKPTPGSGALHVPPNIFPLTTPNPTTEQDRQYVHTEGVTLVSGTWGEASDPTKERGSGRVCTPLGRDSWCVGCTLLDVHQRWCVVGF
jgi:hypothetical protein